MTARFRCAYRARDDAEPRYATASTVRRWLLVEQPGPWGVDAVLENRMPSVAARELANLATRLPARVVVIRRHGGRESGGCTVYAAATGVRARWLESFELDAPQDVLDLDLSQLRHGRSVGGRIEPDPLLLVCTNGRHDPCCAEFGRPVASALDATFGDRVWEVSHIGGDRFAGNVVVLPDGFYFGGLDADRAVSVAKLHVQGRIDLEMYRGCSAYPFVVQAAEYFLRRDRALDRIDAVHWIGRDRIDDRWRVAFDTPHGDVAVDVAVAAEQQARKLTCRSEELTRAPRYELLGMRPAD